jgi:hypothetical protein
MLTAQQQAFVQAIEELDLEQVQRLLASGLDPNFIDPEKAHRFQCLVMVYSNGGKWSVKPMKLINH